MAEYNFVAIDLGATSGRVMLATFCGEGAKMEEVHRFPSPIIQMQGHFYWDLPAIYASIIKGMKLITERGIAPTSIGIDTWGVDIALFAMMERYSHCLTHIAIHIPWVRLKSFLRACQARIYISAQVFRL